MEVIRSLKNIICGKNNLFTHISLFSIIGILTLAICNIISLFIPTNYFGYPPSENYEFSISIFLIFIISIFLCGYMYDFAHIIYSEENSKLPEIKIDTYKTFIKIFPLIAAWGVYSGSFTLLGIVLFKIGSVQILFYYLTLELLIPFILILFIEFAQNFKYKPRFFDPFYIIKILRKTFLPVIIFILKTSPFYMIISLAIVKGFHLSDKITNSSIQLGARLLYSAIILYISYLYNLIFINSTVIHIKNKNI